VPQFYVELSCTEELPSPDGIDISLSVTLGLVTTNSKPAYKKNATASVQVLTSDFEFIEFRRLRCVSKLFLRY
jgi:hypothetical protein